MASKEKNKFLASLSFTQKLFRLKKCLIFQKTTSTISWERKEVCFRKLTRKKILKMNILKKFIEMQMKKSQGSKE